MADRLFIGVLGNRNAGKSHTWNALFNRTVRRGTQARPLTLRPGECVDVFLVSGSFEERQEYAGEILDNQDCRVVLCSMQYTEEVQRTLDYVVERGFDIYIQWLNPGFSDPGEIWDRLGLVDQILAIVDSSCSVPAKAMPMTGFRKFGNSFTVGLYSES